MKNKIYIQPIQSGKTTKLYEEATQCSDSPLIVSKNPRDIKVVPATSPSALISYLALTSVFPTHLFVDDYLQFSYDERKILWEIKEEYPDMKWTIRTTSSYLYDKAFFKLAYALSKEGFSLFDISNFLISEKAEAVSRLMYNFIVCPDFEIESVQTTHGNLSLNRYRTDVLGEWLK